MPKNDNDIILERMRGIPATPATPATDADPHNPNVVSGRYDRPVSNTIVILERPKLRVVK